MLLAHLSHGLTPGILPTLGAGFEVVFVLAVVLIFGGFIFNKIRDAMAMASQKMEEARREASKGAPVSSRREALEQRLQRMREQGENAGGSSSSTESTASTSAGSSGQPSNLSMDEMRARMRARQEYERRRAELRRQREAAASQSTPVTVQVPQSPAPAPQPVQQQPRPVRTAPPIPVPEPVRETRRIVEDRDVVTLDPADEVQEHLPRPKPQPQSQPRREPQKARTEVGATSVSRQTVAPGPTLRLPAAVGPVPLRDAIIMREVLDKPLALREP